MDSVLQKTEQYLTVSWSRDNSHHSDHHRGPRLIVTTKKWKLGSNLSPSALGQGAPGSPAAKTHFEVAFPWDPHSAGSLSHTPLGKDSIFAISPTQ